MAFYLRKISKEKVESNHALGKTYLFLHKDTSPKPFKDNLAIMGWMSDDAKANCYGIICDDNGTLLPLFPDDRNYIVTESGRTYSKI